MVDPAFEEVVVRVEEDLVVLVALPVADPEEELSELAPDVELPSELLVEVASVDDDVTSALVVLETSEELDPEDVELSPEEVDDTDDELDPLEVVVASEVVELEAIDDVVDETVVEDDVGSEQEKLAAEDPKRTFLNESTT